MYVCTIISSIIIIIPTLSSGDLLRTDVHHLLKVVHEALQSCSSLTVRGFKTLQSGKINTIKIYVIRT